MLSKDTYRGDAETQSRPDREATATKRHGRRLTSFAPRLCVSAVILTSFLSCSSKPTDLRTLVPADTLIYLEANDLAAALRPVVDNKAFEQAAKSKPDLSALNGVQLAVAVTGFETSEEKLTEEHSVGRVQPRFVAIADTHAWNWQAVRFAEQGLGGFVASVYDTEPAVEISDSKGGRYFAWTAADGRKAFALVVDSLIFFGNDETAIDKCLTVRKGEADSFAKAGKVSTTGNDILAAGYVSSDGVGQLANIIGISYAAKAADDADVQSVAVDILPQLIRGAVTDISWNAVRTDAGIVDKYVIAMPGETAAVLSETLVPSDSAGTKMELLPADAPTATFYDLKDPRIAWRSVLLTSQKVTSPEAGRIIGLFASLLFQPYAINDAELFLSGVGTNIVTANFGAEGEQPVVIAEVKDPDAVRRSLSPELKKLEPNVPNAGFEIFRSDDGDLAAAFVGKFVVAGDAESVIKCLRANGTDTKNEANKRFGSGSRAAATTVGLTSTFAREVAEVFGETRAADSPANSTYVTETRFNRNGIERRTISDFGLIGSIIAQLNSER